MMDWSGPTKTWCSIKTLPRNVFRAWQFCSSAIQRDRRDALMVACKRRTWASRHQIRESDQRDRVVRRWICIENVY
jgi:hypothetical protein